VVGLVNYQYDQRKSNAVDSIFLPSTTPKENVQPKKSKAKTTHRLLTADDAENRNDPDLIHAFRKIWWVE
jgi:hypothetical protein